MQEKPCISLTVMHLFCSENTRVTLAAETRTLGCATPEVALAAERCSGSLWAHPYCGSLGASSGPRCCSHASSWPPPVPQALVKAMTSHCCRDSLHQALLPRSHLAWLHTTCSSKLPELTVPPNVTTSQNIQHVPHSDARKAPSSQAAGQLHIISQTPDWKITQKNQYCMLGLEEHQKESKEDCGMWIWESALEGTSPATVNVSHIYSSYIPSISPAWHQGLFF